MKLIDKDKVVAEIERIMNEQQEICKADVAHGNDYPDPKNVEVIYQFQQFIKFLDTLEVKEVNEKSETAYKSKIIKVKCISPFDETWENMKVYICEKWHHEDLNMDFWDVYYDYDNNPKYVQFSSIEMLEKEFAILRNDTLEVKEADLEKEMSEYFVEHPDEFFSEKYKLFAKHFFELGLKAKKGE